MTHGWTAWLDSTPAHRRGAARSTAVATARSTRSPWSGWSRSWSCSPSYRRCAWRSARSRPRGRSTSCPASGSAQRRRHPTVRQKRVVDERDRVLRVIEPVTGEVHAEHQLVAPGASSILDAHYDRPTPRHTAPRCASAHGGRAGVPRPGPGRRAVPGRCCRRWSHQAQHRDRGLFTLGAAHGHRLGDFCVSVNGHSPGRATVGPTLRGNLER